MSENDICCPLAACKRAAQNANVSAAVVPSLPPSTRHGSSLQLGREKEEQRKPPETCKQVLMLTAQRLRLRCHLLPSQ